MKKLISPWGNFFPGTVTGRLLLFKGQYKKRLNSVLLMGIVALFYFLAMGQRMYQLDRSFVIAACMAFLILCMLIIFLDGLLKNKYNHTISELTAKNEKLAAANHEILAQNKRLIQNQENLKTLNVHLEKLVAEKILHIKVQNDRLLQYTYNNAHHLRGPVARLQGLIHISKLDPKIDQEFLFEKIKEQAIEIDEVVKRINNELQAENLDALTLGKHFDKKLSLHNN